MTDEIDFEGAVTLLAEVRDQSDKNLLDTALLTELFDALIGELTEAGITSREKVRDRLRYQRGLRKSIGVE